MILNTERSSIASLPFDERVRIGKQGEAQMIQHLKETGYQVKPATTSEDMYDKIDGWLTNDGVTYFPFQSKYRETGGDIGMDIREPWFGHDDPNTKLGRDYRGKAQLYVTQVENTLYLMHRIGLHMIVDAVMTEWKNLSFKFDFGDGIRKGTFNSRIFPGVQFKLKIDERSQTPKIMAYIPPSAVKEEFRRTFTVKPIKIEQ